MPKTDRVKCKACLIRFPWAMLSRREFCPRCEQSIKPVEAAGMIFDASCGCFRGDAIITVGKHIYRTCKTHRFYRLSNESDPGPRDSWLDDFNRLGDAAGLVWVDRYDRMCQEYSPIPDSVLPALAEVAAQIRDVRERV